MDSVVSYSPLVYPPSRFGIAMLVNLPYYTLQTKKIPEMVNATHMLINQYSNFTWTSPWFIYLEKELFLDRCRVLAGVVQWSSYMWVPSEAAEKWPSPLLVSSTCSLSRWKCFTFLKHTKSKIPTTVANAISSTTKTARRASKEVLELSGSSSPVSWHMQSISVVVPSENSSLNAGVERGREGGTRQRQRQRERERERERKGTVNVQIWQYLLIWLDVTDLPLVLLATDRATCTVKVLNGGSLSPGMVMSTSLVFRNVGCEMSLRERVPILW